MPPPIKPAIKLAKGITDKVAKAIAAARKTSNVDLFRDPRHLDALKAGAKRVGDPEFLDSGLIKIKYDKPVIDGVGRKGKPIKTDVLFIDIVGQGTFQHHQVPGGVDLIRNKYSRALFDRAVRNQTGVNMGAVPKGSRKGINPPTTVFPGLGDTLEQGLRVRDRQGFMEGVGLKYQDLFENHPLLTTAGTAATGLGLGAITADPIGAILDGMTSDPLERLKEETGDLAWLQRANLSNQLRAERFASLRQENMARLAASSPELYNQLAAGRRLPQGSTRIGGGTREDILGMVASAMASGSLTLPQTLEQRMGQMGAGQPL